MANVSGDLSTSNAKSGEMDSSTVLVMPRGV
jgi:hypothetical protein